MAAVVNDVGKKRMLDMLSGFVVATLATAKVHLYSNNLTPAHGDLLSAYIEATWAGSAAQTAGAWNPATLDGTFHGSISSNPLNYMNTSGSSQVVYGYYVTDAGGSNLLWAERFTGAPLTVLAAQTLQIIPNLTLTSEF